MDTKLQRDPYKNLFWSGVVSAQLWQTGQGEKRPIGLDLKAEKDLYEDLEVEEEAGYKILFDPRDFND